MFMQSSGGLTDARMFQGKDAILSGPAGGVVGCVRTSEIAGFEQDHRFRHGRHLDRCLPLRGEYERVLLTQVAGVRMRAPMMNIHTVAAGGGSILQFDGTRMRVGPTARAPTPAPPPMAAAARWR